VIIGPRRIILIGAIAAIAATIILLPIIFAQTAPDLNKVDVRLSKVSVTKADEEKINLKVVFTLANPTEQTATTSKIEYELFADGVLLGQDTISYEDIPPNGRPAIFGNGSVDISDPFVVEYSDDLAALYDKIENDTQNVRWGVKGTAQIESTLTTVPKDFENEI
jgi:LEA14-like dessication related protein